MRAETFEPFRGHLMAVAYRMLGSVAGAEDVVQETLIRAYRSIDRFDGRYPRAWLLTILRNTHTGLLDIPRDLLESAEVLGLFVEPDSENYIWRFFCRMTDPVVRVIAMVTPKDAPPVLHWLFGFVWLFWLRVGLLNLLLLSGTLPKPS